MVHQLFFRVKSELISYVETVDEKEGRRGGDLFLVYA